MPNADAALASFSFILKAAQTFFNGFQKTSKPMKNRGLL